MNAISPRTCAHCAAPLAGSQARFCCAGCDGAHALVAGLGLDAFYRRRDASPGAQRPDAADATPALANHARPGGAGGHEIDLLVSGMTCGACVWLLEAALAAEPDVLHARASLTSHRLSLRWSGPATRAETLARVVTTLGFRVTPWSAACLGSAQDDESRRLLRALGIAAFGAANVMILSFAVWAGAGGGMGDATRAALHWVAAAIALPVVALAGQPFFRSALAALQARRLSMDVAVSLAVLATAAMSLSEAMRGGPYVWFDGATSLLALLLAGRVLERAARGRARRAVAELLALQATDVQVIAADGSTRAARTDAVPAGARVLVACGERLCLDGVLETSDALLDTAPTTGETLPRRFVRGEALPAASINHGAALIMRVARTAADGSIARMAALLEQAEQARGRTVALADRVARFYVPSVLALSFATLALWWGGLGVGWQPALVNAVAVLIVTCPCGLAIAIPAVQVVAVGALFRRGVLVRSGSALERLATVDCVVLDKTGTLTLGRPMLRPDPTRPPAALRAAAAMARTSRHPLARALAAACPDAPAANGVLERPGEGLLHGSARLGSAAHCGVAIAAPAAMSLVYVAAPDAPPIVFHFDDAIRRDAAAAVAGLRALGLEVEILSGDAIDPVRDVAAASGAVRWSAAVTPAGKARRIAALQAAGWHVLMVGDGINDAAALAAAHASASFAEATDLAQAVADVVLQGQHLQALPEAIIVARRAHRLSRQSLGLALAYNAIAVPAAVFGLVSPLGAALVMATSSLVVIGNALRAGREATPR